MNYAVYQWESLASERERVRTLFQRSAKDNLWVVYREYLLIVFRGRDGGYKWSIQAQTPNAKQEFCDGAVLEEEEALYDLVDTFFLRHVIER